MSRHRDMKRPWVCAVALSLLLALPALAAQDPDTARLGQRLQQLQADPTLGELAPYERLQAQQAIDALDKAKRKDRDTVLYIAEQRVQIAETAARTAAARQQLEKLEGTRNGLLVQASQQEAARARQETERMRIQAQIQAEEAENLRQAAEAEALARQQAEVTLTNVAGQQAARLSAAQRKEVQLAREEAELVSGAKLPPSKFDSRGEVFTLSASSFDGGPAKLSAAGNSAVAALAAYLQASPKARVRIEGAGADTVRDALAAAGVTKSRLTGGKGAGKDTSATVIVAR